MCARKLDKDGSVNPGELFTCKYSLRYEQHKVSLIADCKSCGGASDFSDAACFTGILNAMCLEYSIDSIILSHHIEKKYTQDSLEMISMMVELVHNLEQMSIRDPFEEYFAHDRRLSSAFKNRQRGVCERCELKPENIFRGLKCTVLDDIASLYSELKDVSEQIVSNRKKPCKKCTAATKSDLVYIFERLEEFRKHVIYKGFQIVI